MKICIPSGTILVLRGKQVSLIFHTEEFAEAFYAWMKSMDSGEDEKFEIIKTKPAIQ